MTKSDRKRMDAAIEAMEAQGHHWLNSGIPSGGGLIEAVRILKKHGFVKGGQ